MKNCINISISAKDSENPQILIIINKFSDSSIFLNIISATENPLKVAEYIENNYLLDFINIFLAEAKKDEYNLKDTDFNEFYRNLINTIFHYIFSVYFNGTLHYDEIKLINLKEY